MSEHVMSTTYLDTQVARAAAALPAGGAYDAAPAALFCPGFQNVLLSLTYTRGGAAGAFRIRVEFSPDSTGANWYQAALYSPSAVVPGADSQSDVQRETAEYQATGAAAESFVFGPIHLAGTVERIRISASETGNVAAPGTLAIQANFGM